MDTLNSLKHSLENHPLCKIEQNECADFKEINVRTTLNNNQDSSTTFSLFENMGFDSSINLSQIHVEDFINNTATQVNCENEILINEAINKDIFFNEKK